MLNADNKQFRLADDGTVSFQTNPTNPLPGVKIGRVTKGTTLHKPRVTLDEAALPEGIDPVAAAGLLEGWIESHIKAVLEPLTLLVQEEGLGEGPAKDIAHKLYDALGILPRAELEDDIAKLDDETRQTLRQRKVRLGPVLVFLPGLNKPAMVRLRALLWALWHDKALPAQVPPDGMTSLALEGRAETDPLFYRACGYPVYGPRAIRVDMLDRLICAVYDSADKGLFKARHQMAEWLGCPVADLYAVLEAMGHKKIDDPAEKPAAEEKVEEKAEDAKPAEEAAAPAEPEPESVEMAPVEAAVAEAATTEAATAEAVTTETVLVETAPAAAPQPQAKPELATFKLRRGRAYGQAPSRPAKAAPGPVSADKPKFNKDKFKGKPKAKFKDKDRDGRRDGRHDGPRPERVISARSEKREEDSPFAMLKNMKIKSGE